MNDYKNILEKLLIEDNCLQQIYFPTIKQPLDKSSTIGNYIFRNGETFKGRIINNILQKGKYTWPNGQIYFGDLSPNNTFNKKGKLIFPNKNELTGLFNGNKNTIEKALYKTSTRLYQGSFKNNKLHGKFIIKNNTDNKDTSHYLFIGNYVNGERHGKFSLEKTYNNQIIQICGTYEKGSKNGEFKIIKNDQVCFIINYKNDIEIIDYKKEDKIENKKCINYLNKNNKICCMVIIEEYNKLYLLIGSYQFLFIYIIEKTGIVFDNQIFLFNKADINDIIQNKDKKFLICSSNNNLILIELFLKEKNNISNSNIINENEKDYELIQKFHGLKNSKNIFFLKELSNEMIVSGDCENMILWGKNISEPSEIEPVVDGNKSFLDKLYENIKEIFEPSIPDTNLSCTKETDNIIKDNYKIINYKALTHTYSILEIKNNNNKIILSVPQPDSKSLFFYEIDENNSINCIKDIKELSGIDSIPNRKSIMTQIDNKLYLACKNKIIIIDINSFEIEQNIFFDTVTYISVYKTKFLLLGVIKSKNTYNYESFLIQREFKQNQSNKKINIIQVSDYLKTKHNGNIIDACIYDKEDIIITIGTDGKILLLK